MPRRNFLLGGCGGGGRWPAPDSHSQSPRNFIQQPVGIPRYIFLCIYIPICIHISTHSKRFFPFHIHQQILLENSNRRSLSPQHIVVAVYKSTRSTYATLYYIYIGYIRQTTFPRRLFICFHLYSVYFFACASCVSACLTCSRESSTAEDREIHS